MRNLEAAYAFLLTLNKTLHVLHSLTRSTMYQIREATALRLCGLKTTCDQTAFRCHNTGSLRKASGITGWHYHCKKERL